MTGLKSHLVPILAVVLFSVTNAFSWDEKTRVAVLEIESRVKGEQADTRTLSDVLQQELVNRKAFVLVERAALSKIIEEQKFKMSGLAESDATKIGNLAGASKIITGSLSGSEGKYLLLVKVIDTETGTIEIMDQEKGGDTDEILRAMPALADRIVRKSRGDTAVKPVPLTTEKTNTTARAGEPKETEPVRTENPPAARKGDLVFMKNFFVFQVVFVRGIQLIPEDFVIIGGAFNVIYGYNEAVYGLQAGFINDMGYGYGLQAGFINTCSEDYYGMQAGAINTSGDIYGAQIGAINTARKVVGAQIGLINTTDYLYGVQIGLFNTANKSTIKFMPIINIGF